MVDLEARIAPYKSAIVKESERWLLWGRPTPFFFFTPAGKLPPENLPSMEARNLAPDGSGEILIPIDYHLVWDRLKENLPEIADDLSSAPSRRYATIVMLEEGPPTLFRLDLNHNPKIIDAVDEQKITSLVDSLREFREALGRDDQNAKPPKSLRQSFEVLLTRLLQRPATEAEVERVLETLSA